MGLSAAEFPRRCVAVALSSSAPEEEEELGYHWVCANRKYLGKGMWLAVGTLSEPHITRSGDHRNRTGAGGYAVAGTIDTEDAVAKYIDKFFHNQTEE